MAILCFLHFLLILFLIHSINLVVSFIPVRNAEDLQPWYHHNRSYQMPSFTLWVGTAMHDGVPFLFTNRNTSQQAIFCVHPKAGSSIIKFLLRYAMMKNKAALNLTEILHQPAHSWHTGRATEIRRAFQKWDVPRIVIVRNPYFRLLSGYYEKIVTLKDLQYGPPNLNLNDSFSIFIDKLIQSQMNPDKIHFNNHFKLMSTNCLLRDGMSYDYHLPIEQMDFWYEALADSLDLQAFASIGWNLSTPYYRAPSDQSCFYRSFNNSCEMMFQRQKAEINGSKFNNISSSFDYYLMQYYEVYQDMMKNAIHNNQLGGNRTNTFTGSIQQATKYYNSPEIIDKVTSYVLPDLLAYNYPIWTSNLTAVEYLEKVYLEMPLMFFRNQQRKPKKSKLKYSIIDE